MFENATEPPRFRTARTSPEEILGRMEPDQLREHLQALLGVTEAVLAHLTLPELLREILDRLHSLLQVDTATILLCTEGGRSLRVRASRGLEEEVADEVEIPMGQGLAGTVAVRRQAIIVDDVGRFPTLSPALRKLSSMMAAPLLAEGEILGVLHVGTLGPHSFSDRDLYLLQVAADRVALAVKNALLYDQAREEAARRLDAQAQSAESDRRFRLLVQEAQDYAIFMLDPEGRVVSWNAGAERIKGYRKDEIEGKHFSVFYTPEEVREGRPARGLEEAAREGRFATQGWRVRNDGSRFWAEVVINAVHDENGELIGFAKITRDVTERKRVADQLAVIERRYQALFESNPDPVFALEPGGTFVEANLAAARVAGRPREEFLGLPFAPMIAADCREATLKAFRRAVAGEPQTFETAIRSTRGDRVELSVTLVPTWLGSEAVGIMGIAEDVTERRRAEQAVQESEERYRTLVEASASIVWSTPASGELRGEQPEWSEFTGQSRAEYEGWGWVEAVHPDDRARTAVLWQEALQKRATYELQHRIRRRDGEYRCMQARAVPIVGRDGEIREWIGVHIDVTSEVEARQELERLYEEVKAASQAKSNFLATISHELRTPLNAIIGYAELLLLGLPDRIPPGSAAQIERIRASARHLLDIIEEILTFSRMEAGREALRLRTAGLQELADEVIAIVEPMVREKGLRFVARLPPAPVEIRTEPAKFRQILLGLLSNAVSFTREGEVGLRLEPQGEWLLAEVRDTGIGIAPEHAQRIFEPFWQIEQGSTREVGGTGLGLTVTRRLVELLGGTMEVQSEPGAGSVFRVRLPLDAGAVEGRD